MTLLSKRAAKVAVAALIEQKLQFVAGHYSSDLWQIEGHQSSTAADYDAIDKIAEAADRLYPSR